MPDAAAACCCAREKAQAETQAAGLHIPGGAGVRPGAAKQACQRLGAPLAGAAGDDRQPVGGAGKKVAETPFREQQHAQL